MMSKIVNNDNIRKMSTSAETRTTGVEASDLAHEAQELAKRAATVGLHKEGIKLLDVADDLLDASIRCKELLNDNV